MKKKVIIAIYAVIILIVIRLITELPYIFWYNHGNDLYNDGNYEEAISAYDIALNLFPSKYKECKIRINMALSMIKTIKEGYDIEERLNVLNLARNVLTDKGCANKNDDNGHSKEAEKLKKDIDKEIELLEKFINFNGNDNDTDEKQENQKGENENQNTQNRETEAKLDKLDQIQKQSVIDRNKELESLLQLQNSTLFYEGKNW